MRLLAAEPCFISPLMPYNYLGDPLFDGVRLVGFKSKGQCNFIGNSLGNS